MAASVVERANEPWWLWWPCRASVIGWAASLPSFLTYLSVDGLGVVFGVVELPTIVIRKRNSWFHNNLTLIGVFMCNATGTLCTLLFSWRYTNRNIITASALINIPCGLGLVVDAIGETIVLVREYILLAPLIRQRVHLAGHIESSDAVPLMIDLPAEIR